MSARNLWLELTLGLGCALVAPAALAADTTPPAKATTKTPAAAADAKPREGGFGKGSGPLLTREQLRQCLAEQDRLKQETAAVQQLQHTLDSDRSEIDRAEAELKAELATARDKALADCAAWVTQHCGPVEGVELLEALSAPAPAEPPNRIEKQATSDTVAGAGRAERGAIERGIAPGDEALCNSGTPSPATGQGEMELAQRPVKGGG